MNLQQALGIAMQASCDDCDLLDFAVYGPRRSGTNYLQKIILLNTLNLQFLCLDKNFNDQQCKLVVNGFDSLGSKHSMSDKKAADKLNGSHINFVIAKSNLKEWMYSRCAYQKTFQPNFIVSEEAIYKWIAKEYLDFLDQISKNMHNCNLIFFKHEVLTADLLRRKLLSFDKRIILTKFPVDITTIMGPSGSITNKQYVKRVSEGDAIIDKYCESSIFSEQLELQQQILSSIDRSPTSTEPQSASITQR